MPEVGGHREVHHVREQFRKIGRPPVRSLVEHQRRHATDHHAGNLGRNAVGIIDQGPGGVEEREERRDSLLVTVAGTSTRSETLDDSDPRRYGVLCQEAEECAHAAPDLDHPVVGPVLRKTIGDEGEHSFHDCSVRRDEAVLLVGKLLVEGGSRNAGRRDDVGHGGFGVALLGYDTDHRLDHSFALGAHDDVPGQAVPAARKFPIPERIEFFLYLLLRH